MARWISRTVAGPLAQSARRMASSASVGLGCLAGMRVLLTKTFVDVNEILRHRELEVVKLGRRDEYPTALRAVVKARKSQMHSLTESTTCGRLSGESRHGTHECAMPLS